MKRKPERLEEFRICSGFRAQSSGFQVGRISDVQGLRVHWFKGS